MTLNLVPNFILEKYGLQQHNGRLEAAAVFVDISGFSAVTDKLMEHGQHGAEVLAGVMGAIFEPLINAVYAHGGFVSGFAGDAFTAVFPTTSTPVEETLAAAIAIQEQMKARPAQETLYGRFTMSAKVGVDLGEVVWGIVTSEDEQRASYFFQGTAIDGSAAAEHNAGPGEIILTQAFYDACQPGVSVERVGTYYKVVEKPDAMPKPKEPVLPKADIDQLLRFVPEAAVQAGRTGEFRHVVNVFISLPTVRTEAQLEIFMRTVFQLEQRYGGLLKQLDYGDKGANLLLFWGAPTAHENDVQRALHFILDLQTQTAIPINGGLTYHVAHAGYIGSSLRGEYTCYGRGVNLAARFMTNAPRGEIWVDEAIARLAGSQFDFEYDGEKQFKGFTEPQKVYILFERKDNPDRLYENRLVGRQRELTQLSEFVSSIFLPSLSETGANGDGRSPNLMIIWGEPGAGKSRLAHEFLNHYLPSDLEPKVFLAQSDEILRQSLNPFRYWLKRYFGQSEGLAEPRNKRSFNRKLDDLIANCTDPELADELDRVRSFLGALVGLRWSDSAYEQADAQSRKDDTFIALTVLLKAESSFQPVILLLEDAHWIDQDSAVFVTHLLQEIAANTETSYPLALLATARYQSHILPLEALPYEEIRLSRLNREDFAALAEAHLDATPNGELVDFLTERSEGNPFFAEQILRYLKEANQIVTSNGRSHLVNQSKALIPNDVTALLVARLDRLTHSVREVVQTAAVLGREFEVRLLSQMLKDEAIIEKIDRAEAESIWSALSEIRYIFRHGLLREAAYRMQLRASRQSLHKLALESIQTLYATDLSEKYGELAYHAIAADLTGLAFSYSLAAGERAMQRHAAAEAVSHFQAAMERLEQVESTAKQRQLLVVVYGRAIELTGNPAAALAHYETIEKLALTIDDRPLELASLVAQATLRSIGTIVIDFKIAEALCQRGLELAEELNDEGSKAKIYWNLINVYRQTDRNEEAIAAGKTAYELAEKLNLREQMAYAANDLMKVYLLKGNMAALAGYGEQSIKLWRELNNRPMLADALATYSSYYAFIGDYDKAQSLIEESLEICRQINNEWGEAFAYFISVYISIDRLDFKKGLAESGYSLALGQKTGAKIVELYMFFYQSLLYYAMRDFVKAREKALLALSISEGNLSHRVKQAKGLLALIDLAEGKLDQTADFVKSYPIDLDHIELDMFMLPEKAVGEFLLRQGDFVRLLEFSTQFVQKIEDYGIFIKNADFFYWKGRSLLEFEKIDLAKKTLERGLAHLRKSGGRWGFLRIARLLADIEQSEGNVTAAFSLQKEIEEIESFIEKNKQLALNYLSD